MDRYRQIYEDGEIVVIIFENNYPHHLIVAHIQNTLRIQQWHNADKSTKNAAVRHIWVNLF